MRNLKPAQGLSNLQTNEQTNKQTANFFPTSSPFSFLFAFLFTFFSSFSANSQCPNMTLSVITEIVGCEVYGKVYLEGNFSSNQLVQFSSLLGDVTDNIGEVHPTSFTNVVSCLGDNSLQNSISISDSYSTPLPPLNTIFSDCPTENNGLLLAFFALEGAPGNCTTLNSLSFNLLLRNSNNPNVFTPCNVETAPLQICFEESTIQGNVANACDGDAGLAGVAIEITDIDGNVVCSTITDSEGNYDCPVCPNETYSVMVVEECEEPCGISTFDLVIMQQAILGHEVDDDYLAGLALVSDVNNDGNLTTYDIICARFVVLGYPPEFFEEGGCAVNNWCSFIPEVEEFEVLQSALHGEPVNYSNSHAANVGNEGSIVYSNFSMYSLGDIDCSCSAEGEFNFADTPVSITAIPDRNGVYEVKMNTTKNIEVFGVEFDLPSNAVEIIDFESNNDMDWSYNTTPDGQLRIIGINTTGTTQAVAANTAVFSFRLNQSVANLELSNYEGNNVLMDNDGLIAAIQQGTSSNRSNFNVELTQTVTQGDALFVQLSAKMEETVNISVFDIFGRAIYQNDQDLNEGINDFNLPISTPEGIYILSVFDGERYQSEKIYWR